jgi:hypothetical protein
MAMNGNDLGDAIALAITSPLAPPAVTASVQQLWRKIGSALVTYLTANAEVPSGIAVTTDPATGTGATTGPGTVT